MASYHGNEKETGRNDEIRRDPVVGSVESNGVIELKLLLKTEKDAETESAR